MKSIIPALLIVNKPSSFSEGVLIQPKLIILFFRKERIVKREQKAVGEKRCQRVSNGGVKNYK
jgi:hypothetical protein